jgi:hypothetical protein
MHLFRDAGKAVHLHGVGDRSNINKVYGFYFVTE